MLCNFNLNSHLWLQTTTILDGKAMAQHCATQVTAVMEMFEKRLLST